MALSGGLGKSVNSAERHRHRVGGGSGGSFSRFPEKQGNPCTSKSRKSPQISKFLQVSGLPTRILRISVDPRLFGFGSGGYPLHAYFCIPRLIGFGPRRPKRRLKWAKITQNGPIPRLFLHSTLNRFPPQTNPIPRNFHSTLIRILRAVGSPHVFNTNMRPGTPESSMALGG